MIIENLYTLSYDLKSPLIYLSKDNYTEGMKVNRVLQFSEGDGLSKSFNLRPLCSKYDVNSLFLDFYYNNKKRNSKNIALPNLSKNSLINFYLDEDINFQISKIVNKKLQDKDILISLALDNDEAVDVMQWGSAKTMYINTEYIEKRDIYPLSLFNGAEFFAKKKVKRIISNFANGYITIKDKEGRNCQNMPLSLLMYNYKNEEIWLRDYEINIYESFITFNEEPQNFLLTFYY